MHVVFAEEVDVGILLEEVLEDILKRVAGVRKGS